MLTNDSCTPASKKLHITIIVIISRDGPCAAVAPALRSHLCGGKPLCTLTAPLRFDI